MVTGHQEEGLVPAVACLQEASFQFWDPHPSFLRTTVGLAVLGQSGIKDVGKLADAMRRPHWWPCVGRAGTGTAFCGH